MKVTIDTEKKRITVLEQVALDDLFDWLEKTLGADMGEYSITGTEKESRFWYPAQGTWDENIIYTNNSGTIVESPNNTTCTTKEILESLKSNK